MFISQTMDLVRPRVVEWGKVNLPRGSDGVPLFKRTENLNYAVELGKSPHFNFSLEPFATVWGGVLPAPVKSEAGSEGDGAAAERRGRQAGA